MKRLSQAIPSYPGFAALALMVLMATGCGGSSKADTDTGGGEDTFQAVSYIIDTGVDKCFDNTSEIACPAPGEAFYGQDAQHQGLQFSFQDNGDGTVSDLNTGLMWQKSPDFNNELSWYDSFGYAESLTLGGHTDWRLPTIKELMSIVDFTGAITTMTPYLDTDFFDFQYPDTSTGARIIDAQYVSSVQYVETVFGGDTCFFGFNFADGRIKCYPIENGQNGISTWYVRAVRGDDTYGRNDFVDNGDGTVTDRATGLMWQQADDGTARIWKDALSYAEALETAGYGDWRLPNVKELQSIVDYTRPAPAIDPVFSTFDEEGWFWSGTTFYENVDNALYVAFGRAVDYQGMDVHGAGALRSDPKTGNPGSYPLGRGPQNDAVRIYNYVRAVRDL